MKGMRWRMHLVLHILICPVIWRDLVECCECETCQMHESRQPCIKDVSVIVVQHNKGPRLYKYADQCCINATANVI